MASSDLAELRKAEEEARRGMWHATRTQRADALDAYREAVAARVRAEMQEEPRA